MIGECCSLFDSTNMWLLYCAILEQENDSNNYTALEELIGDYISS